AEAAHLIAERLRVRAVADDRQRELASIGVKPGQRIDEDIDTFEPAQFAEKDEIGRIGIIGNGRELLHANAVVNDADNAARLPDLAEKGFMRIGAFKKIQVATLHQAALEQQVQLAADRTVQAAAMRRIGA